MEDVKSKIPYDQAKVTNFYELKRIGLKRKTSDEKEFSFSSRPRDLNFSEEEIAEKLEEWVCTPYSGNYVYPIIERGWATFFYLPKEKDRVVGVGYTWPFGLREAWKTLNRKRIVKIPEEELDDTERLRDDYSFISREFNASSGTLVESYGNGEGVDLVYKTPLERVATQEQFDEAISKIRDEWKRFSGGRYPRR